MKQKIKTFIKSTAIFSVIKIFYLIFYRFTDKNFWVSFSYYLYNNCLSYFPSYHVRILYLRHVIGISIGRDSFIHMGCFFEGNMTSIGNNTVIGRNCYLGGGHAAYGSVLTIKDNVSITAQTYIFCTTHLVNSPVFEAFSKSVVIEDYAWVGARAMILPGVRIGTGSVLGAGSTATKDIPDYSVYAGTPARKIGDRTKELSYNLLYFPYLQ
jgi:maltose O-acetyltransferase